jgi:hypothetical protein
MAIRLRLEPVKSYDYENQRFDDSQRRCPRRRQAAVLLFACKANISLEAAPGLVHRRAAVGVGTLRNGADCRPTGPRAPVAQLLNLALPAQITVDASS